MKRILIGVIILGFFVASFLLNYTYAEERLTVKAVKAVILFMEGDVKVKGLNDIRWRDGTVGMVLSKNDSLKTGVNSWAEIGFGEDYNNVIRIKENTLMELTDLGPIKLGLLKGEIRSLVEELEKDSTFEIKTPTAVCGARGTGWDTNTDGRKVIVDAYEDKVYFYRLSQEGGVVEDPIIRAGKRGMLEDPARPITIEDLPPERMRDWDKWKEDFSERRGIEKRDAEDKAERLEKGRRPIEDIMKGKEGVFERRDQDKIRDRLEKFKGEESQDGQS